MKYPMLNKYLAFERVGHGKYKLVDQLDRSELILDAHIAFFASRLDGKTDPLTIGTFTDEQRRSMLDVLKKHDLLRCSRVLSKTLFSVYFGLWFPTVTRRLRIAGAFWNFLLLALWLPVLGAGIHAYMNTYIILDTRQYLLGFAAGLLAGMVFHELSHASAALAYGAPFYELGITIGIIPGAYVLVQSEAVESRWKRIQINAAGTEMNFFLCGVFLLLMSALPSMQSFFWGAAIDNAFIGLINLMLINGLDGMKVMDELLGDKNFLRKAAKIAFSRARISKLKRSATGQALIASSFMIVAVQAAMPVLLILNFLEVLMIWKM